MARKTKAEVTDSKETKELKKKYAPVMNILKRHKGKGNEIRSKEIAKLLCIKENATYATVRSLITNCIQVYHLPVAANPYGYYIVTKESELNEYCNNLDNRASGINGRKNDIIRYFKESQPA